MGGDRADFYEKMMTNYHFTPQQISTEFTILQLIALFKKHGDDRREMLAMAKSNSQVLEAFLDKVKALQAKGNSK